MKEGKAIHPDSIENMPTPPLDKAGGIPESQSNSVEYYRQAAIKGNMKAQLKLVEIYSNGLLGEVKDQKEAFRWRLVLAENGNKNVTFGLAQCYFKGRGTKRDEKEAVKWFKIAVENGSVAAMNSLALCYQSGRGVQMDEEAAFSLYHKAAMLGSASAANNLSLCYYKGIGTKINIEESFFWKEKAAEGGVTEAQKVIAEWYWKGIGAARDLEKALYWYVRANVSSSIGRNLATVDDAISYVKTMAAENATLFQHLLAKCYEYGVGIDRNGKEAKYWFNAAAANGCLEAMIKLRRLSSVSTKVTEEELAASVKDEYGVRYTKDWKKVLSCSYVKCKDYKIRKGTRVIADEAFAGQCITKISIPSSVVVIGSNPFMSAWNRNDDFTIESGSPNYRVSGSSLLTKGGRRMISYWGNDQCYVLPECVEHIGDGCFRNAGRLTSIKFSNGVRSIGKESFRNCHRLRSLDLPLSVKSIGQSCFRGCEDLIAILSLGSVDTIKPRTFEGCGLRDVNLPSSLKRIEEYAFSSNENIECIDLPEDVQEIGDCAFAYCRMLHLINFGRNLKRIGNFSFYGCRLDKVKLPSSLSDLGASPFSKHAQVEADDDSMFCVRSGMIIKKETGSLECYCGKEKTLNAAGIKTISPLAFYQSNVKHIHLPDTLEVIPEFAFYGASSLKSIALPDKLKWIGKGAFGECKDLEEITVPAQTEEVQKASFSGCSSLKCIEFKSSATRVSEAMMESVEYGKLPQTYKPDGALMGKIDLGHWSAADPALADVIKIIVPTGARNNYSFQPTFNNHGFGYDGCCRNFEVIESDE